MMEHFKFQVEFLPIPFDTVSHIIVIFLLIQKRGYFYPCGRDFHFRPMLVYNAPLIDFKDFDTSLKATCFVL